MKSNHERNNGCLPPKKREMLSLEHRPVAVATAPQAPLALPPEALHTENLAWLASVATERCKSRDAESHGYPISSSSLSVLADTSSASPVIPSAVGPLSVPLASLPTVYPSSLPQQPGTIQYAQLTPNVQFISSGPYAGYISSHILSANPASTTNSSVGPRHHLDGYTTAIISPGVKGEQQQQFQIGLSSADLTTVSMAGSTQVTGQYIHLDSRTSLPMAGGTVSSQAGHLPLQLHTHQTVLPQTLTFAPSQLVVQYSDGSLVKKVEGHGKALLNGEGEVLKQAGATAQTLNHHQQVQSYEARHILLPADYAQNHSGLQTSLVLVAQQPTAEPEASSNKLSLLHKEKGGISLGKPVHRTSASYASEGLKSSGPQRVLQTGLSPEEMPASLYTSTQPSIIGYISSGGHQHAVSYHGTLPQHLVIPSGQSLLIPVSGTSSGVSSAMEQEVSHKLKATTTTTHISTTMPHAYLATALSKCEVLSSEGHQLPPTITQASPLPHPILPSIPAPSPVPTSPVTAPAPAPVPPAGTAAPSSSPVALPPFFMRGSIIQLADGELKRVEDLKTEDFIQSAEISSELKIDSSTVERIDDGQTPNAVVIQFAVGELKAQVCVEVLLEYPFFVFGQGWSSCSPDRTTRLFELSCAKLCVGDVCVSLTLRGLRNGSVASPHPTGGGAKLRTASPEPPPGGTDTAPPRGTDTAPPQCHTLGPRAAGGSRARLLMKAAVEKPQGNGTTGTGGQRVPTGPEVFPWPVGGGAGAVLKSREEAHTSGNGDVRHRRAHTDHLSPAPPPAPPPPPPPPPLPPPSDAIAMETQRPSSGRKRRWSAPEREQTDRREEASHHALPQPSFLPQEMKISIEGRSSAGS
ncbi:ataxin-1a [Gadus macrocephalus]|uniref:ataxin-1a n=1 Tax=Gadus macrocephalus TaxID=80720 RepID=UPI0028CB3BD3|nr:ataxin-1a [Gadus macrocephalus]XP_059909637.1 ataxin-1a [Gadus macrocephalus]